MALSTMTSFLFFAVLKLFYFEVCGFNLEVSNPQVLNGPAGSYFGYSVAVLKNKGILVGAPQGNDTTMPTVSRPGAVYNCPVPLQSTSPCTILNIDNKTDYDRAYSGGVTKSFHHAKDGQWLGGSLQVPHDLESKGAIVACAHRWINRFSDKDWFMNGFCYMIPEDFTKDNIRKLPLLVDGTKQTFRTIDGEVKYNYGMGGYGMAVHYTQQDDRLLFGAPGIKAWSGSFIDVEVSSLRANVMTSDTRFLNETQSNLAGYTITSGSYFASGGQVYYAVGIPRDALTGSVRLFAANSDDSQYEFENYFLDIEGKDISNQSLPLNSYFGSSLHTADVNKDGLDDLLVGAPMYSPKSNSNPGYDQEVGMVLLYLGTANSSEFEKPRLTLVGGGAAYARFGTSIMSLGDISKDSYTDIAIGAPYEDEGLGAVYIYNGYRDGLWHQYSQRIAATALAVPGLQGFGISFANAADINSDDINDVVIGAYLSDQAVLLYGQPVISLDATMEIRNTLTNQVTSFIEQDASNTAVYVCFSYHYNKCPKMYINITVALDVKRENRERLVFKSNHLPRKVEHHDLFSGDRPCYNYPDLTVKSTSDLVSPIAIAVEYGIEHIDCSGSQVSPTIKRFDGNDPGDPKLLMEQKVEFKKDCPNNKCNTNLHLDMKGVYKDLDGYFVIGTSSLKVQINITKTGDPSYGSVFYLVFPEYIEYNDVKQEHGETEVTCALLVGNVTSSSASSTDIDGDSLIEDLVSSINAGLVNKSDNESVLVCQFGNPLANDTGVFVNVFMTMPVHVTEEKMQLSGVATTQSNETDMHDNRVRLEVLMRHHVTASLTGVAAPDELFVQQMATTSEFKHIYELRNQGPSTLPSISAVYGIPHVQKSGNKLLSLKETSINCRAPCTVECVPTGITLGTFVVNGRILPTHNSTEERDVQNVDCTSSTCGELLCNFTSITPGNSAEVYLKIETEEDIETLIHERNPLAIVSRADIIITNRNVMASQKNFKEKVVTRIMPRPLVKTEVDWWVILLSILGGIFFIAILVLVLWKVGFFKRKTRDEMLLMKSEGKKKDAVENGTSNEQQSYTDSECEIVEKAQPPPCVA